MKQRNRERTFFYRVWDSTLEPSPNKKELSEPEEERRRMEIEIKNHFVRNSKVKAIHLEDMIKIFEINWDKRVVEKGTGVKFPYGYVRL